MFNWRFQFEYPGWNPSVVLKAKAKKYSNKNPSSVLKVKAKKDSNKNPSMF